MVASISGVAISAGGVGSPLQIQDPGNVTAVERTSRRIALSFTKPYYQKHLLCHRPATGTQIPTLERPKLYPFACEDAIKAYRVVVG